MPNIVEGEPGIFPDPVARVLRGIAGIFRRPQRRRAETDEAPKDPPAEEPGPEAP
ncbi:MAG TPA: hypothetical protein VKB57_06980 [Acidimicrobiales bacterium]|nr:hypothetical protein [Acidimicrobiales bacterium]